MNGIFITDSSTIYIMWRISPPPNGAPLPWITILWSISSWKPIISMIRRTFLGIFYWFFVTFFRKFWNNFTGNFNFLTGFHWSAVISINESSFICTCHLSHVQTLLYECVQHAITCLFWKGLAQLLIFTPHFPKLRAFRMLPKQHVFLEFLVGNEELLKKCTACGCNKRLK